MSSLSQTLDLAFKYHQAGDYHQAELLYRQVLQIDPLNADALHLLGLIAQQAGRSDLAADYIQQALRLHPEFPAAHNNLGNALKELGKVTEASASYEQALRLQPDYAEAHHNLGLVLHDQGKLDEAIAHYQQALHLQPDYAAAHNNLGNAWREQDKLEEATASYRQALRSYPNFAAAYNNLGIALQDQGKSEEAIFNYRQALRLKPDYAEAYSNLGIALREQGQLEEAMASYRQALRLRPDYAEMYNNLGMALKDQDKFDEAIANYREALRRKPDFAGAYLNLGNALKDQGKLDEALTSYQQAVRLKPDLAQAHFNLATLLLLMGDFSGGWQEYEWRWQTKHMIPGLRLFSQPLWQGNPLHHGVILLHAEQGLGDTIQFIRFAALVKQHVGTVLCECPPSLTRLLRSCAGIDRVIPCGEPLPALDTHAPLLSLPGILKTTLETIPARIPYLWADSALKEAQAREMAGSTDFKIGVVWQGNPKMGADADLKRSDGLRSIPLTQFEPLACVPGVRLFSLQKGFGTEQLDDLAGRFPITDLVSACEDFNDTAAIMKNLDLVISVDSSPAHLAGALGVPVWVPLPTACDWRRLTQREDSPWYPTMRLFRQTSPGDWSDVFERMARELRGLVRTGHPS